MQTVNNVVEPVIHTLSINEFLSFDKNITWGTRYPTNSSIKHPFFFLKLTLNEYNNRMNNQYYFKRLKSMTSTWHAILKQLLINIESKCTLSDTFKIQIMS